MSCIWRWRERRTLYTLWCALSHNFFILANHKQRHLARDVLINGYIEINSKLIFSRVTCWSRFRICNLALGRVIFIHVWLSPIKRLFSNFVSRHPYATGLRRYAYAYGWLMSCHGLGLEVVVVDALKWNVVVELSYTVKSDVESLVNCWNRASLSAFFFEN